jgi:hypothetical protein
MYYKIRKNNDQERDTICIPKLKLLNDNYFILFYFRLNIILDISFLASSSKKEIILINFLFMIFQFKKTKISTF